MTSRRLLFLLPLLGLLPHCKRQKNPSDGASTHTVVLLSANTAVPYELAQSQNLMRLIATRAEFNLVQHDAEGSAKKQSAQLAEVIASKPHSLLISPVDHEVIASQIEAAVQAGIIVIGLGEKATSLPCSTVLKTDHREMGRLAGEAAVRALTRKAQDEGQPESRGRIVEIRGDEEAGICQQRHEGFVEVIKKAPGLVIVHDAPGGWTRKDGRERTAEAVRLQSSFDVVYAHNDAMALGAAMALGENRENVLIIGSDGFLGEEGGLTLVSNGGIDISIFQPVLVDLAWKIIQRQINEPAFQIKPSYKIAPLEITPKNAPDLMRKGMTPLPEL